MHVAQLYQEGAAAWSRIETAISAEDDNDAIDTIDRHVSGILQPVRHTLRPDGWWIARGKIDALLPDLFAWHRAKSAAELAPTGG